MTEDLDRWKKHRKEHHFPYTYFALCNTCRASVTDGSTGEWVHIQNPVLPPHEIIPVGPFTYKRSEDLEERELPSDERIDIPNVPIPGRTFTVMPSTGSEYDGGEQWMEEFYPIHLQTYVALMHLPGECGWSADGEGKNLRDLLQAAYEHLEECQGRSTNGDGK